MLKKIALLGLALSCGCSPTNEPATTRVQLALEPGECANQSLRLTDLHADFRDIWKGLEVAETGKQANPNGSVVLNFSAVVQPASVVGNYTPIVTDGTCGNPISTALASAVISSIWGSAGTNAARKAQPAPLNVFTRESISGVVSAAGALAAGGDITLTNVSTNWTARQPIGMMAGGKVTLANGSISGDVTYGVQSTIPQTISISGTKSQQPFDALDAFENLTEVANLIANESTSGTVQSSNGSLVLTGTNTAVNVFRVSASVLRQSTSLQLQVPNGAGAIVDVTGGNVQLQNTGISLLGATPATILWNFARAKALGISSVGIPGSILAPLARVTFDSGSINGTVVARSFTSAGSGTLQYSALNASLLFGTPTSPTSVALMAAQPLVRGCSYRFSIPNTTPLSSSSSCLDNPISVTFRVTPDHTVPGDRELVDTQIDPRTNTLGLLVARTGINTPVLEALGRYEASLGISVADLVPGSTKPSFVSRTQPVTAYQQVSQGYSVSGYGYVISSENGIFRNAVGRVAPVLPIFPGPSVTQATALQTVLSSLKITQPPWVARPSSFHAPVGGLLILPIKTYPTSSDFKLVWNFRFGQGTGITDPLEVQVDAAAGTIVGRSSGYSAAVPTFDPTVAVYTPPPQTFHIDTTSAKGIQPFTAVTYQSGGNSVATPGTDNLAAPGTITTNFDSVGNGNPPDFRFVAGPAAAATNWTLSNTGATQSDVATTQWALESANAYMVGLGLDAGGNAWTHIDGPAGQQQVVATTIDNALVPVLQNSAFYVGGLSSPSVARLFFSTFPISYIAPDVVAHEYDHALVDSMRRGSGLPGLASPRDAGAVSEGLADLFGLVAANSTQLSGHWFCVTEPNGSKPCKRNIADPHSSSNPEAYLDPLFFTDYSTIPLSGCDPKLNDECGKHLNSTVVSHWGYLLVAGAATAAGQCGLTLAPLDADPKISANIALNIALRAITMTALSDKNDPNISFQGYRDATVLAAQKLQDGLIYPGHDLVKTVKLAWDAVGLPPDSSDSSAADGVSPPDNSEGVAPWVKFTWPTSGLGQASPSGVSSWDFQLADSPAFDVASIKFANATAKPITDTMNQGGKTVAFLKLSLPYTPSTKFYWRVRPHGSLWAPCYPIHSFTTTGIGPEIKQITFPMFPTDDKPPLLRPGSVLPSWERIPEAVSYELFISPTVDSSCNSATGVVQKHIPFGPELVENIQPGQRYYVGVRPVGPPDFAGNPASGPCTKAEFTTAAMRAPTFANYPRQGDIFIPDLNAYEGVFPFDGTSPPYFVWDALDGPDKYRVEFREIVPGPGNTNLTGTCSARVDDTLTYVITDPCPSAICRKQARNRPFPGKNPAGYCVTLTSIATNGKESPPSEMSRFFFQYKPFSAIAPGVSIGQAATYGVTSIVASGYGKDVDFSWNPDPNASQYVVKVAPWPLNVVGAFEPRNCAASFGFPGSRADELDSPGVACGAHSAKPTFSQLSPTTSAKIAADKAGKGRYCWWAYPVTDKESGPQAMVDVYPQFCYRTDPDTPKITIDNLPDPNAFSPTPITGHITTGYVPDAQFAVEGTPPGAVQFNFDKCAVDSAQAIYDDVYDCDVTFSITPQKATSYTITAKTWNSDQHPPVKDGTTAQTPVTKSLSTGTCGALGKTCCGTSCDPGGTCIANKCCAPLGSGAPQLLLPLRSSVELSPPVPLTWLPVAGAETYEVTIHTFPASCQTNAMTGLPSCLGSGGELPGSPITGNCAAGNCSLINLVPDVSGTRLFTWSVTAIGACGQRSAPSQESAFFTLL